MCGRSEYEGECPEGCTLGKGVQDNGYGQFLFMLGYKLEECGKHLIKVDRYFASSKICSVCGHKKKDWHCRTECMFVNVEIG